MRGRSIGMLLFVAVLVGLGPSACRTVEQGMDWGWRAERPAEPRDVFSHSTHRAVFAREDLQCVACHAMSARITDEKDAAAAIAASKDAFTGGKDACHACHFNPQTGNTAPDRCSLCHVDARAIQPANHNFDWLERHQVFAKNDAPSCETCHQPRQCQDCHARRDQTVRNFHDRTIRFTHGIEARANPMRCGQCHTSGFCQTCHREGGYEK